MPTTILDNETYPEALQRRYAEETKAEKQAEIIRMAEKACAPHQILNTDLVFLERFFNLAFAAGAAHEREACAKVCEELPNSDEYMFGTAFAALVAVHEREKQAGLVEIIEQLWNIIDDIDTYGDMAKADDKLFRGLVERRQNDRWKTGITTDGYTLTIPDVAVSIDAAVLAEREACAKVCEELDNHFDYTIAARQCAAAIRARGEK